MMTGWLMLSDEQRKKVLSEAELESGIQVKAIEKDWWVTLVLKALFQGSLARHLVFKGGTSLSKGWGLISRFSEDIDIALDPIAFGYSHKENPDRKYITALKRQGCQFTSTTLKQAVELELEQLGVPPGYATVVAAEVHPTVPDTDPQSIFVRYPSLFPPGTYLKDEVKIEVSVRSTLIPSEPRKISSLLFEYNPKPIYAESGFIVETVHPKKTFLEKILLLHEDFQRIDRSKIRVERKSRHYYDLYCISRTEIAKQALKDENLFQTILAHREKYNHLSWVDYAQMVREMIHFLPPKDFLNDFYSDYKSMQEVMIYGENIPDFDEILVTLRTIQAAISDPDIL